MGQQFNGETSPARQAELAIAKAHRHHTAADSALAALGLMIDDLQMLDPNHADKATQLQRAIKSLESAEIQLRGITLAYEELDR